MIIERKSKMTHTPDNLISLIRTLVRFKSITPNDDGGIDYIK